MNTLTAPQRSERRHSDLPHTLQHLPLHERTPRTALLDRMALRLALTLLLWSTRPVSSATRVRAERDRERREREWQLRYHRLPLL